MQLPKRYSCLLLLTIILYSCSKDKGVEPTALAGNWHYENSTYDTSACGCKALVTIYDNNLGGLGESLDFRKGDTVYYSYRGIVTWSNYKVSGRQLILTASNASDTLVIKSISAQSLTIGWPDGPKGIYWVNFSRG